MKKYYFVFYRYEVQGAGQYKRRLIDEHPLKFETTHQEEIPYEEEEYRYAKIMVVLWQEITEEEYNQFKESING